MGVARRLAGCGGVITLAAALAVVGVGRSVWWCTFDLANCPGCQPSVDWSNVSARAVTADELAAFDRDGAVVLPARLSRELVAELDRELEALPNTLMTSLIARYVLRFYRRYEHMIHTRSALMRDFAVHGPFGAWAAQLLRAPEVRLYNAELIFHAGADSPTCQPAWHRDSVAAPFPPEARSAVFNVYLAPIDGDSDGLIYEAGSQAGGVRRPGELVEPRMRIGDVLVHHADVNHTTAGRACWRRRSVQLRYVASEGVRFAFGPNRLTGPIPWTFAHAPALAPHGLREGDPLAGPWYPRVHPSPLPEEHARVGTPARLGWSPLALARLIAEANATMFSGEPGRPPRGFFALQGRVDDPRDWALETTPVGPAPVYVPSATSP